MEKKNEKKFIKIDIIPFQIVALNTHFTERQYFSSGVTMLRNSLKVSDTTE